MQDDYETLVSNLLNWINDKIVTLQDKNLPNNLELVKGQVILFKDYLITEKPPKFVLHNLVYF